MSKVCLFTKVLFVAVVALVLSSCKCGTNNAKATDTDSSTNESEIAAAIDSNLSVETVEVKTVDGHECVDLGLPSGLLWATCNVGANTPEDAGEYYACGETETKEDYSWDTYKFGKIDALTKYNATDGKEEFDMEDDVAHVKWGGIWRMPTREEQDELRKHSAWIWNEAKKGYDVKSKTNGNSIFLPAAGYRKNENLLDFGSYAYYWSRSIADMLDVHSQKLGVMEFSRGFVFYFSAGSVSWNSRNRNFGHSVRPVCSPAK